MFEIVCEDCQHTQWLPSFETDIECENCGSPNITQTPERTPS